jgi:uncharacterized protein YggE
MRSSVCLIVVLVLGAGGAAAQPLAPAPVIESTGESTVYAAPTFVDFRLEKSVREDTMESAMAAIAGFEAQLRGMVAERDLRPLEAEVAAPSIFDINDKSVRVTARLRFPMTGFVTPETGPRQFAVLCDKIVKLGADLPCLVYGPFLDTQDRESMIRSAVAAATETAYPQADAVAGSLRSAILAVDSVRVIDIAWNQPPAGKPLDINLRQISCTAKVTVLYTVTNQ